MNSMHSTMSLYDISIGASSGGSICKCQHSAKDSEPEARVAARRRPQHVAVDCPAAASSDLQPNSRASGQQTEP